MSNTLRDLSAQLGLSASTVSRALSGRDSKRPSTRARAERIRAAAAAMGYAPNSMARSLKTRRRQVVGLILPNIMNDYYATAATLVQETLATEGYRVLLSVTNDDPAVETAQLRVLQEERVAGIVRVPSVRAPRIGPRHAPVGVALATPTVELVRQDAPPGTDAVLIDDVDAGRQGTAHVIALGHRRIGILTGPQVLSTAHDRLIGYRRALDEAGLLFDEALVDTAPYRRDAARAATMRMLRHVRRPTAFIATSNELVVGVLQALAACGVRMPDDLSVVGFGNPDWFALLSPALTTVALPIEEMAMAAVHLLLKRIRAMDAADAGTTDARAPVISRYQARLIVRGSTRQIEPAAQDD